MKKSLGDLPLEEIARRIAEAPTREPHSPYPPEMLSAALRPAAVLIPLLRQNGAWHLLFIRRTEVEGDIHSGQVAFPGGGAEPGDPDLETTALREAQEEIGLQPQDVRLLGRLNDFLTISNYRVTPIIGAIPWPYLLRLDTHEVSRAFTIPLDWLADPRNCEKRLRPMPPPYDPIPVYYFKPYNGETLWGASARFTVGLLRLLSGAGEPGA